ncbi:MAG: (S)-ureidoglycine aminohydrolase [Candidatus Methylacidiphilaceae bacterium]
MARVLLFSASEMTTFGAILTSPAQPVALGTSRTVLGRRHALLDPAGHVRGGLPGFPPSAAVVLISPQMGAKFAQFLIELEPQASGGAEPGGIESFFFSLAGDAAVDLDGRSFSLSSGGFLFIPAGPGWILRAGTSGLRAVLFQKNYVPHPGAPGPAPVVGRADPTAAQPFLGDPDALLQTFLPESPAYDMAVNLFRFRPGAALPFVETHVMEHGLCMLEGRGIYRLEDSWYPVRAGDAIWMAPYCPQWFAALGPAPASYLYYKDMARHPLSG